MVECLTATATKRELMLHWLRLDSPLYLDHQLNILLALRNEVNGVTALAVHTHNAVANLNLLVRVVPVPGQEQPFPYLCYNQVASIFAIHIHSMLCAAAFVNSDEEVEILHLFILLGDVRQTTIQSSWRSQCRCLRLKVGGQLVLLVPSCWQVLATYQITALCLQVMITTAAAYAPHWSACSFHIPHSKLLLRSPHYLSHA
mmetsp:Transcript_73240/g.136873  ORF Transcript_73240/g.136873 Transcript_73240/m.136873 type:complete len:201 (-) Transcript_73240:2-604(-)